MTDESSEIDYEMLKQERVRRLAMQARAEMAVEAPDEFAARIAWCEEFNVWDCIGLPLDDGSVRLSWGGRLLAILDADLFEPDNLLFHGIDGETIGGPDV